MIILKKLIFTLFAFIHFFSLNATLWNPQYQEVLMEKLGGKLGELSTYPSEIYPNCDPKKIINKYPDGKILIFGYGSLMNHQSATRTVSKEALQTMKPVVAFGLKRIFNYKVENVSARWGTDLPKNEKAMLNVEPTTTYKNVINGVVIEVSPEELIKLIKREEGYDLAPIFVADWNEVTSENLNVKIQIAYTFYAPNEMRKGINYTETKYYPVRGYLNAVREGAIVYGEKFLNYWNSTTYLSDGTTPVSKWDEKTFSGILGPKEPMPKETP